MEPIDILWGLAPTEIKLELAFNLITEILKVADGHQIKITLDDGDYEIVMNKLEATTDQK